jgi:iron complex outermembrane recepter protein
MQQNQFVKLFVFCILSITSLAQAADTHEYMEEIIVTTKRGDTVNLQTISEAVTSFSGDALEREAAVTLEDFNHAIPNVQLEHVGLFQAAASFSMRGIGTAGIESFADPVVAVFVDDVYYSRNAVALLDLFDVESVTAFRGPQGTLYGRNAFAGAISVRTKRPSLEGRELEIHLDAGNYGRTNAGLVFNQPIGEKAAFRIAATSHEMDGFFENDGVVVDSYNPATLTLTTRVDEGLRGRSENGEKSFIIRPSLRLEPNENWRIDIIGEIWDDEGDGTANWSQCYQPGSLPAPLGTGPSGAPDVHTIFGFPCKDPFGDDRFDMPGDGSDPFEVSFNLSPNQTEQEIRGITVDTSYQLENGTLSLVLNHREVEEDITTDTDGFNWDLFSSSRLQEFESTQLELRYATTINENIDVLTGFFYLKDEYQVEQLLWIFLDSALFGGSGFTRTNPAMSYGTNEQERTSLAGYVQVDWRLNDQWTLNLGGRYTTEKKDDVMGMAINDSACPAGTTPATSPAPCNGVPFQGTDPGNFRDFDPSVRFGPVDEDWNAFSPRLGLEYQVNDDVMLFGFWQRAFKSGGFVNNAGTLAVFQTPYDQEQVDNFELGVRSDLMDGRLRLNANVFFAEYEDLQRGVIRAAPTSTGQETFTDNAAGAESFGVELTFNYAPTDSLSIYGNVGYLDIEYDGFIADLTGDGIETDNSDLDLVRAPKWDMNIGVDYSFDLDDMGTLTVGARYSYTDEMMLTTPNDVGFMRDELTTVDAQIMWRSQDEKYQLLLWGRNLSDEVERLGGTPVATLFAFASGTQPKQYGATFIMRFSE